MFTRRLTKPTLGRALVAAALASTLALSGCGASDSGSKPGSGVSEKLTFGSWGGVGLSLDPHRDGRVDSNLVLFSIYDRLVHQKPDGTLIPGLATEWKFTDDVTLTMKTRSGVTFQDGTPFNAESVKANIERAKTIDGGRGPHAGTLSVVKSVEVTGADAVTFHLTRPFAALPTLLSDQPGAMISPKAFDTDLAKKPVGAGMYTLDSYTDGSQASFTSYAGYWDKPAIMSKKLQVLFQPDQARRVDAFKAGQLDATFAHTAALDKAKRAGIAVSPQVSTGYFHLLLNRSRKPFDNKLVRQAMSHAINRQGLIKTLLEGYAEENQQPFRQNSTEFNKDLGAVVYDYNPAKSRELLKEAGFGNGLKFTCVVTGSGGGYVSSFAELVQDNFKEVGIDMQIKLVDAPSTPMLVEKSADCGFMPYGTLSPEVAAKQLFSSVGYQNPGGTSTPEMESLIAEIDKPMNDADRKVAFDKLTKYVMDEGLYLNLFYQKWSMLADKDVKLKWHVGGQYTEFRADVAK